MKKSKFASTLGLVALILSFPPALLAAVELLLISVQLFGDFYSVAELQQMAGLILVSGLLSAALLLVGMKLHSGRIGNRTTSSFSVLK